MDEKVMTPPAIVRALSTLEALKTRIPPEDLALLTLVNQAQLDILSITLKEISDDVRRVMILESAGVDEAEDGTMAVRDIFEQDRAHLVAIEAISNSSIWLENAGYIIIRDPTIPDDGDEN